MSHNPDLDLAFDLAQLAGSIALGPFHNRDFVVWEKADGSPVTDVDREVERALRDQLGRERPGQRIDGEEHGRSGRSEHCWYVDPIDGTKRFIRGDPRWMTLIALAVGGEVVLGVVALPALGERWWASRGDGAFHDGQRVAVSSTDRLAAAVISDEWRESLAHGVIDTPLADVAAACARVRPHRGHSFLALAAGEVDVALQLGSHPWDYAPVKIIVEEAGGTFTDFEGGDRIDTGRAVATNSHLHRHVLELLTPWRSS